MLKSKFFKISGVLDNKSFVEDLKLLSNFNKEQLNKIIDLMITLIDLNLASTESELEKKLYNFSEQLNLEFKHLKKALSLIWFFHTTSVEHKLENNFSEIQEDLIVEKIIDSENKELLENLQYIFEQLHSFRDTLSLQKKEELIPSLYNIDYSINLQLVKEKKFTMGETFSSDYSPTIEKIIPLCAIKIEIQEIIDTKEKNKVCYFQVDKKEINHLIEVFTAIKADLQIAQERAERKI